MRPDLVIEPVRGNVDTRLRKLHSGQYDAIMLAAAGLLRLGLADQIAEIFSPEQMCPAAGQGALAIETREHDEAFEICRLLNHEPSWQAVACERTALQALGGGCQLPIGAYAEAVGTELTLNAAVITPDGSRVLRFSGRGDTFSAETLGERAAHDLLARGARDILETLS
jgi:hydroxymethylbilane synthase